MSHMHVQIPILHKYNILNKPHFFKSKVKTTHKSFTNLINQGVLVMLPGSV